MRVVHTLSEARNEGGSVALVPTMGALHEGHLSLLQRARVEAEVVMMSIFVNPLQFNDRADLERYPRDLERDAAMAEAAEVDILFAPDTEEMYPVEPRARVTVTGVSDHMEGARRPGHFEGVATVVAKLFAGLQPDVAVFGRKDAQQVAVIRRVAQDLSFPVRIVSAATVRAADGLALSSRNSFLSGADRAAAVHISAGLFAACDAVERGERAGDTLEGIARSRIEGAGLKPEYVILADAVEATPVDALQRESFLAVAARVGQVRLIDNVFMWPDGSTDRGIRLDESAKPERP